jgi:tight adherence protein C
VPVKLPVAKRAAARVGPWLDRLDLLRGDEARIAAATLAQAGWRGSEALLLLLVARLVAPLLFALLAWGVMTAQDQTPRATALVAGLAIAAGALAPAMVVRNAAARRRALLARSLPDALDLFVICAEAGLSLDAALRRVAREIAPAAPALADELALTGVELGFLPVRADALNNFATRVPLPAVRGLVNLLLQTERYGTPLAQTLRILAAEFRSTRMLEAEAKAARLPAVLTIPMIVFALPPLFIILVGPAILQVM